MKKILVIVASLQQGGGAEKTAYNLSKLDPEYNVSYLLFYNEKPSYRPKGKIFYINETLTSNPWRKFLKLFQRALYIKRICQKEKIDICIGHMEESNIPLIISKIIFANRAKAILCIHNNLASKHTLLYRFLTSLLYASANRLVGVSAGLITNLPGHTLLLKNQYTVIHNAIDQSQINNQKEMPITNPLLKTPSEKVITIGRLHEQKNISMFIRAMKNTPRNTMGIIIGEGQLRQKLEHEIITLKLSNKIHLLGFQSNVYQYLAQANIFVLSSQYEGFGIVVVEALACGIPVIATDCFFGPREILAPGTPIPKEPISTFEIAQYGILTPINNSTELARAIQYLINNTELQKHYRNKAQHRAKDFNLPNILNQWHKTIKDL